MKIKAYSKPIAELLPGEYFQVGTDVLVGVLPTGHDEFYIKVRFLDGWTRIVCFPFELLTDGRLKDEDFVEGQKMMAEYFHTKHLIHVRMQTLKQPVRTNYRRSLRKKSRSWGG